MLGISDSSKMSSRVWRCNFRSIFFSVFCLMRATLYFRFLIHSLQYFL